MFQFDLGVFFFQFSLLPVHLHKGMALAAWVNSWGKRRRRNGKLFSTRIGKRQEEE